jgi:hypothetical protein
MSPAHAFSCTFSSVTATADGENEPISTAGCLELTTGGTVSGPLGATVNGNINLAEGGHLGTVSGQVTTSGNATLNMGGQINFAVLATPPPFIQGIGSKLIDVSGHTYDVSLLDFQISGLMTTNISGSGMLGAFVQTGLSATPTTPDGTVIGGTASASIVCGNAFTICSLPQILPFTAHSNITPGVLQVFDITTRMSENLQLTTIAPNSNTATIDASDPFEITSIEVLDANGVPIPGFTFVAEDGTTFPDAADSLVTPLPATLPLFVTGLGALGLLGWRRKRGLTAVAA